MCSLEVEYDVNCSGISCHGCAIEGEERRFSSDHIMTRERSGGDGSAKSFLDISRRSSTQRARGAFRKPLIKILMFS